MAEARVRIILDDEVGGGSTWVTTVPVPRSYPNRSHGVALAAGQAAAMFISNIMESREAVAEKLIALERADG